MEALAAELLGALRDDASGAPAAASARAAPSLTAPRVAQAAPLQPVQLITSAEQAEAEAAAALPPRALPLPPAAVLTAAEAPARLAQQYLLDTRGLRIHSLAASQRVWHVPPDPRLLLHAEPTPQTYNLTTSRHPLTAEPIGFEQTSHTTGAESARTSLSMTRAVGPAANQTFGSTLQKPFMPGGLDEESNVQLQSTTTASTDRAQPSEPGQINASLFSGELTQHPASGPAVPAKASDLPSNLPTPADVLARALGQRSLDAPMQLPPATTVASSLSELAELILAQRQKRATEAEGAAAASATTAPTTTVSAAETESLDAALAATPASAATAVTTTTSAPERKHWAVAVPGTDTVPDFVRAVPHPAYTWPFPLDNFQKQAIVRMERHESVFVAAHTSAGKTVVAEYAIAMCQKHMTRCVYTSPIKALSNQKFRDFRTRFEDVGLLTGDVQIKPEASCLIMTTEILRSMLYRGADLVRDIEWVIFDEVHYVNDAERGVVWEEVIIMLPQHINIVMLSATVPNTFEFADWVGRTKRKVVHVISTAKRPVPLEHYLFTGVDSKSADELFKVVDSNGNFLQHGYKAAFTAKKEHDAKKPEKAYGARQREHGTPGSDRAMYLALINMLKKKDLQPCVIFTFSKKRCEQNADILESNNMLASDEKGRVLEFFARAVSRLSGTDRQLPQVLRMRQMLGRGIGVHHGGLLPILKEVVEMLFAQGLVKVLFATETFAMGVNMPARCVVFDTIRKHDGQNFRDLLPGEYVQMAGRAGRRGLDATGTVILLCKGDVPAAHDLHQMMLGKPTSLTSRFRLTYNMILNMLRVEELRMEDMMRRSFSEHSLQSSTGNFKEMLSLLQATLDSMGKEDFPEDMEKYYDLSVEAVDLTRRLLSAILNSGAGNRVLAEGRVVVINTAVYRNCLAVILRPVGGSGSKSDAARAVNMQAESDKRFHMLILCEPKPASPATAKANKADEKRGGGGPAASELPLPLTHIFKPQGQFGWAVTEVLGVEILCITPERISVVAKEIMGSRNTTAQSAAAQQLLRVAQKYDTRPPMLDPINDMNLRDLDVVEMHSRVESIVDALQRMTCTQHPDFVALYGRMHERKRLYQQIQSLAHKMSDEALILLPEYQQRVEVLKALRFVDQDGTVQLKGRVACEVTTCDEVLVTELIFNGVFSPLEPEEIVALLSALVFQEKKCSAPTLTKRLEEQVEIISNTARMVAETQQRCGMDTPPDVYLRGLHWGLVEVVYEWARGMPFQQITGLTDVVEGSIVRCIVRLDETCRDVRNAARVIGDPLLYEKMERASQMIKRDIVFAASLYTT